MFIVLALLLGTSVAQRPSDISTCDYYAEQHYGTNNNQTQLQLMQDIVALAFGGKSNSSNVTSDITGILNPGVFQDHTVDLQQWFNGSIASTNLNGLPAKTNWLDGGGLQPLRDYLNGVTSNYRFTSGSNQDRLFINFLADFGNAFNCSQPPPSPGSATGGGRLNLAYVHKYMNLTYTDLGYFIDQLSKTTTVFGFSDADSQTLNTKFNSLYNVRCAPPITLDPAEGPQLLSLCQDPSCPLAVPNTDCSDYVNLAANPVVSGTATTAIFPISTSTSPTSTGLTVSSSTPVSKAKLSAGAIAGVAIGAVAGALCLVGVILFWFRRRKARVEPVPPEPAPPYEHPYTPQQVEPQKPKQSMSELESPTNPSSTHPMTPPKGSLTSYPAGSTYNYQNMAEMEGH